MSQNDYAQVREDASGIFKHKTFPPVANTLDANGNPTITAGTDAEVRRYTVALGAARNITCASTGAWVGAKFRIVRVDTAAFTLDVKNHDAATIKQIPSATAAFVDVVFDGTNWVLAAYGTL